MKTELSVSSNKVNNPGDLEINIILTNISEQELKLWTLTMDYPSLYLEVKDGDGKLLDNLPASVPPANAGEEEATILKQNESLHYTTHGFPVSDELLKKGNYMIRCHAQLRSGKEGKETLVAESKWIAVEIE